MFDGVLLKEQMPTYVRGNVLCISLSFLIPLAKANRAWYFKLAYRFPPLNLTVWALRAWAAVSDVRSYPTDQQTSVKAETDLRTGEAPIHTSTEINLGICPKSFKMKWLSFSLKNLMVGLLPCGKLAHTTELDVC